MQGDPTWIQGNNITIVRTFNGFAVVQAVTDPAAQSIVFDTWDDLSYYLNVHFANAGADTTTLTSTKTDTP